MIIEKRRFVTKKFCNVTHGTVFEYNGIIYMCVPQIDVMDCDGKDETICNAIDLISGNHEVFNDELVIVYDNAKVVIE